MWQPYKDGSTVGTIGTEQGIILRDEKHSEGARVTLEKNGMTAPCTIVCGI